MSELDDLTQLLKTKTIEGKIQWVLDDEDIVSTIQGENLIEIIEKSNHIYTLILRNSNGIALARKEYLPTEFNYIEVRDVFEKAKRTSLGVDQAIDDFKTRLMHL